MTTPLKTITNNNDGDTTVYGTIKRQHYSNMWQVRYERLLEEHSRLKDYVDNNKNSHVQVLEAQLKNLKVLLDQKNQEIHSAKHIKDEEISNIIEQNVVESITDLSQENHDLRQQLMQVEEQVRQENCHHLLKIQSQYQQQLRSLNDERSQLKKVIDQKIFEINQLKDTIEQQHNTIYCLQEAHQSNIESFQTKISLLELTINQNQTRIATLEEKNQGLHLEVTTWEKYLAAKETEFKQELEALQREQSENQIEAKAKNNQILIQKQSLEADIKRLTHTLSAQTQDLENVQMQRDLYESEMKKLRISNDELKTKLLENERLKVTELEDLRKRLEESSKFQCDNLKSSYQTQIGLLQEEIQYLKQK